MADGRKPEDRDAALWQAVTKGVKPIKRRAPSPRQEPPAAAKPAGKAEKKPAAANPQRLAGLRPTLPPAPPPAPELRHGQAAGVDKRTVDRLRRGQIAIESEIDLHGHTLEQAHAALQSFISGQQGAGRRCVRVVTGKGTFREGGGVLRSAVPRWLNEAPLRDKVLAFSHARRDDGGEGALYVLLRRKRPAPLPGQ